MDWESESGVLGVAPDAATGLLQAALSHTFPYSNTVPAQTQGRCSTQWLWRDRANTHAETMGLKGKADLFHAIHSLQQA